MFPIGIMYYFGTNLDNRFSMPGFWPTKEQSNKVPRDPQELEEELERLRLLRLERRRVRLEAEALEAGNFAKVEKLRSDRIGTHRLHELAKTVRGREG